MAKITLLRDRNYADSITFTDVENFDFSSGLATFRGKEEDSDGLRDYKIVVATGQLFYEAGIRPELTPHDDD